MTVAQIHNPDQQDWDLAICKAEPDAWFAESPAVTNMVKQICRRKCPLRDACLQLALEQEADRPDDQRWGVWGGMSVADRIRLKQAA